jgi:hypothetical protein
MEEAADQSGGVRAIELLLQVVGTAAALAAWTALVGGAHEVVKFDHAGVPSPLRAASMLPRQELIAIGASVLAGWIVVGVALAATAYMRAERSLRVTRREENGPDAGDEAIVDPLRLALVSLVPVFALALAVLLSSGVLAFLAVVLFVPLLAIAGFLYRRTPGAAAAAAFVIAVGVGGALQTGVEWAKSKAELDSVVVDRREARTTVRGYFVASDGGDVHVAVLPKESGADDLALVTVPKDEIESVVIGPPVKISEGKAVDTKSVADVPGGGAVSSVRQGDTNVTVNNNPAPSVSVPERPPRIVLTHQRLLVHHGVFIIKLGPQPEAVDMTVKIYAYRRGNPHLLVKPTDRHVPAGGRLIMHVHPRGWLAQTLRTRGHANVRLAIGARSTEGSSSVRARLRLKRS